MVSPQELASAGVMSEVPPLAGGLQPAALPPFAGGFDSMSITLPRVAVWTPPGLRSVVVGRPMPNLMPAPAAMTVVEESPAELAKENKKTREMMAIAAAERDTAKAAAERAAAIEEKAPADRAADAALAQTIHGKPRVQPRSQSDKPLAASAAIVPTAANAAPKPQAVALQVVAPSPLMQTK